MTTNPTVLFHKRDLELEPDLEEGIRTSIERRCQELAGEFREATRFEVTISGDGASYAAHGHATGKNTDVATRASASEPGPAVLLVLDKIEKQLRRQHDKRIFAQRRDAQRDPPKRHTDT